MLEVGKTYAVARGVSNPRKFIQLVYQGTLFKGHIFKNKDETFTACKTEKHVIRDVVLNEDTNPRFALVDNVPLICGVSYLTKMPKSSEYSLGDSDEEIGKMMLYRIIPPFANMASLWGCEEDSVSTSSYYRLVFEYYKYKDDQMFKVIELKDKTFIQPLINGWQDSKFKEQYLEYMKALLETPEGLVENHTLDCIYHDLQCLVASFIYHKRRANNIAVQGLKHYCAGEKELKEFLRRDFDIDFKPSDDMIDSKVKGMLNESYLKKLFEMPCVGVDYASNSSRTSIASFTNNHFNCFVIDPLGSDMHQEMAYKMFGRLSNPTGKYHYKLHRLMDELIVTEVQEYNLDKLMKEASKDVLIIAYLHRRAILESAGKVIGVGLNSKLKLY